MENAGFSIFFHLVFDVTLFIWLSEMKKLNALTLKFIYRNVILPIACYVLVKHQIQIEHTKSHPDKACKQFYCLCINWQNMAANRLWFSKKNMLGPFMLLRQ